MFRKIIPYFGFLGTAIGGVVAEQQVNISFAAVFIIFYAGLLTGSLLKIPATPIRIGFLFFIATLPGTIFSLFQGDFIGVQIKQYFGLFIFWMAIWIIFEYNNYSPEGLFKIYLRCAKYSAAAGIFQQLAYLSNAKLLYDFSWLLMGAAELDSSGVFLRVPSFFTEPSYFAVFLIPAIYFSLQRLFGKSNELSFFDCILFIISIIFTFSTIGYIGLLLCILFTLVTSFRNLIYGLVLIFIVIYIGYSNNSIVSRVLAIPNAVSMEIDGSENFSTLNNGVNLSITKSIIADYPLTGIGIGSYRLYSIEYVDALLRENVNLKKAIGDSLDGLTLVDGGSMYLRMAAELGLAGALILTSMFFYGRRSNISQHRKYIAISSILFILVFSIRSGQLIRFDFMFFCALFSLIWFEGEIGAHNAQEIEFKKGG